MEVRSLHVIGVNAAGYDSLSVGGGFAIDGLGEYSCGDWGDDGSHGAFDGSCVHDVLLLVV